MQTKSDKLNEESLKLKEGALVFSGKSAGDITKAIKEERINRIERISTQWEREHHLTITHLEV